MATSAAMNTSNDRVKYKITVTQNSQNVNNNTSNVTVSVRFYRTNTGYTTYGSGTVYCKINGTTYSASVTPDQKITNSGIVLFTKTLNISHNADGTKTLTTSAWINLNTPLTSTEQSYSQALTTIPRATTPTLSASSVALGSSVTISLPRASSGFTHTLTYKFGNASGTIGSNLGTSASWTPPLSLASQIPNSTSGTVVITCTTYNGSTKIGAKSVNLTVTVPASVVPTIGTITLTEAVSGLNAKIGAFVQGQSNINVSVAASGAYGSTISNYISKFGSSSFNGASFTITNINTSGSVTLTVTVTDSRGRKATKTQTVTVLPYQIPEISLFTGIRCDQNGNADEDGQYVQLTYSYDISPLNNRNDKTITIAYRQVGASSYTTLKTESNYSANGTTYIPSTVFSVDNSYEFKITVADYFKTVKFDLEVTTAFTLVDYSAGGHGMAIGKVAESEDLLEIALPVSFSGSDWTNLTLDSAFTLYNNVAANQPQYKAIGEMVFIRGIVSPVNAYTSSNTLVTIATGIPAALRPPINLAFICQGSGLNKWLLTVTTGGAITISRYGITANDTVPNTAWLTFAVNYCV